jgi:hypothetical protein
MKATLRVLPSTYAAWPNPAAERAMGAAARPIFGDSSPRLYVNREAAQDPINPRVTFTCSMTTGRTPSARARRLRLAPAFSTAATRSSARPRRRVKHQHGYAGPGHRHGGVWLRAAIRCSSPHRCASVEEQAPIADRDPERRGCHHRLMMRVMTTRQRSWGVQTATVVVQRHPMTAGTFRPVAPPRPKSLAVAPQLPVPLSGCRRVGSLPGRLRRKAFFNEASTEHGTVCAVAGQRGDHIDVRAVRGVVRQLCARRLQATGPSLTSDSTEPRVLLVIGAG